jgi:hypothetical protein
MSSVRREPTLPSRVTALKESHVVAGDAIRTTRRGMLLSFLLCQPSTTGFESGEHRAPVPRTDLGRDRRDSLVLRAVARRDSLVLRAVAHSRDTRNVGALTAPQAPPVRARSGLEHACKSGISSVQVCTRVCTDSAYPSGNPADREWGVRRGGALPLARASSRPSPPARRRR